jgi:hypothetical protein
MNWLGDHEERSPQSSFCSSDTTNACPKPSTSPGYCQKSFFSSIGRLKKSWTSVFTFSNNEALTSWFTNYEEEKSITVYVNSFLVGNGAVLSRICLVVLMHVTGILPLLVYFITRDKKMILWRQLFLVEEKN